jgi:hypothetical protein
LVYKKIKELIKKSKKIKKTKILLPDFCHINQGESKSLKTE